MVSRDALDHQTRKLVYNYVNNHPGSSFSTILEVFHLTEGTLRYHLQYLERHSIVRSEPSGNHRCYYLTESNGRSHRPFPQPDPNTLTDLQQRIVTIIRQKPGIGISELETLTSTNRRVLQYNIKVLRDSMLVLRVGNGRSTRYKFATEELLQNELVKYLTMKFLKGELDEETFMALKGGLERERIRE